MRNTLTTLFLLLLALSACKPRLAQPADAGYTSAIGRHSDVAAGDQIEEQENNMATEKQGWDESLGEKTLRGSLYTTKGHSPMVEGVMISTHNFDKDYQKAHDRIEELKGKTLELTGEVIRHHCGPLEQCLSPGYIDGMREVKEMKVVN